jgi:hypothetical protein
MSHPKLAEEYPAFLAVSGFLDPSCSLSLFTGTYPLLIRDSAISDAAVTGLGMVKFVTFLTYFLR